MHRKNKKIKKPIVHLTRRFTIPTSKLSRGLVRLRWGFVELEPSNPLSRRVNDLLPITK
jgi:hypothetical protein